ncbi:MAG: hypothetical protein QXU26_01485 [Thermofilaceae archaeon]
MELVDAEKKEVMTFLSDISRFLTSAYIGIGCAGLVRAWSDTDFVQLDALFSGMLGAATLTLVRYLALALSLVGIGLLVFASIYYLARVYRYLRFVTPVTARRLYVPFSLIFAGSSTMVGMLAPHIALSKLESHRINFGLFQIASTISLTLLGLSFATLGILLYAVGRRWWEDKEFKKICALLCLLAASLPIYPLGMVIAPSALLLVKGLVTSAVNRGAPSHHKVSGTSVVGMLLCSVITLGMVSSVVIQSSPLIHYLPVCPSRISVSAVQLPVEDGDRKNVDFLLLVANPTEKTLIIDYATISLTINGFKHQPIPMNIPYFSTDTYSIYLLYCVNCALHLAPHTASIYMYRVEIVGEEPTTLALGLDAVVGVQRKDYVYMCGRYVEDNLVVLG